MLAQGLNSIACMSRRAYLILRLVGFVGTVEADESAGLRIIRFLGKLFGHLLHALRMRYRQTLDGGRKFYLKNPLYLDCTYLGTFTLGTFWVLGVVHAEISAMSVQRQDRAHAVLGVYVQLRLIE